MSPHAEGRTRDDELAAAAAQLLADVLADPDGSVSLSAYETGRLVSTAPWLAGHQARLEFLLRTQNPDGSWGGPDSYALVPTLSATAGLLAELVRQADAGAAADQTLTSAARAGVRSAHRWLDPAAPIPVPDTVAVELIVPALLAELVELLPPSASSSLRLPAGIDHRPLTALRTRLTTGRLPPTAAYCLEVLGPAAAQIDSVQPHDGAIGASAAATATWLGGPEGPSTSLAYLQRRQARAGGPVPTVTTIAYFEASWVLNSLAVGGISYHPPAELLDRLASGLAAAGIPCCPGQPGNGDDTASALAALLRHGRTPSPDPLLTFHTGGYFRCFASERNPSVSTNAHALEALCLYLTRTTPPAELVDIAATTAGWLRDQQRPDGSWWDKWHASPYYATACCVTALIMHGGAPDQAAVDRAVDWVRATQRSDGSWGRWSGTVEETAYAVRILCLSGLAGAPVRRAAAYLADPPPLAEETPLWHGKDLYTPVAVVRAARLAARQLAARSLAVPDPPDTRIPAPRTPSRLASPILPRHPGQLVDGE